MAWPITDGDVWRSTGGGAVWDTAESGVEFLEGLGYDGWRMSDTNGWSSVVDLDALEVVEPTLNLGHILSAAEVQFKPNWSQLPLQVNKLSAFLGKERPIQRHGLRSLIQRKIKIAVIRKDILGLLGEVVEAEFLFVVPFVFVEGDVLGDVVAGEGVGLGVRGIVPVVKEKGDVEEVARWC